MRSGPCAHMANAQAACTPATPAVPTNAKVNTLTCPLAYGRDHTWEGWGCILAVCNTTSRYCPSQHMS
ncbi:MAG: hypothetical protein ACK56I_06670, partial [bacterium]